VSDGFVVSSGRLSSVIGLAGSVVGGSCEVDSGAGGRGGRVRSGTLGGIARSGPVDSGSAKPRVVTGVSGVVG